MEEFRSKSYNNDGRFPIEGGFNNNGIYISKTNIPKSSGFQDFRSYSTSNASSSSASSSVNKVVNLDRVNNGKELKIKKGKSTNGGSLSKSWSLNDPELQRKKRVASYKVYSVEGKVKGSFKNSFRWIKDKCTKVVYGWR